MNISGYEKIELLKETIAKLYEKEGRSLNYISKLLGINRKKLSEKVKEWNFKEAEPRHHLTPSNRKFLNKHRSLIKSRLDDNISITEIAKELKVNRHYLQKTIIPYDEVLNKAREDYVKRIHSNAVQNHQDAMDKSKLDYKIIDYPNEKWTHILGYEDYMVSNFGRIKRFTKRYKSFHLVQTQSNKDNNREYVSLYTGNKKKNVQVSRLVAHAFVAGFDSNHNTVNHKDGNVQNNTAENLEWVSQSENNQHAYQQLKRSIVNKKTYRFTTIVYKKKYEFKTVAALARFLNKSETQIRRYLDNPAAHDIKLIR